MSTILIVDDDVYIGDMLAEILTKEGYRTARAYSGTEALMYLSSARPDLILLDLMLPGMTGEELIAYIRDERKTSIPVIVLSAKGALEGKLETIRSGADDYMTKPFEPEEVLVRVMALLRRSGRQGKDLEGCGEDLNDTAADKDRISYKNLTLDEGSREVRVNGKQIPMTPHEFEILRLLTGRPDKVFSRASLYEQVWGGGYYGEDNTVNVHVSNIRKKIASVDPGEEYIKTVWGIGFRMA